MAALTRLVFDAERTLFNETVGSASFSIAITPHSLAARHWHEGVPSPLQLEMAIDDVETALMNERLAYAARGELATSEPLLASLPGLNTAGSCLSRDEVELLFEHLASAAFAGHQPVASVAPTSGPPAAALLILRECMHHLGFETISAP